MEPPRPQEYHKCCHFEVNFGAKVSLYRTVQIQDQTARSVQSDLDLHCPQKVELGVEKFKVRYLSTVVTRIEKSVLIKGQWVNCYVNQINRK